MWEIFIFPSHFWTTRRCMSCESKISLNFNLVNQILLLLLVAIIFRELIGFLTSFEFILLDVLFYIFFILIPFFVCEKACYKERQIKKLRAWG